MSTYDEIRASLVADLSLSHVFYHDAEYEADDLLQRLKKEWAHELAEEIRDFAAKRLQIDSDDETYGMHMAADLIDPKFEKTCPYTHAHTRHWCGYEQCRDS